MLRDDIRELLKTIEPDIQAIEQFWQTSHQEELYAKTHATMQTDNFWQHPDTIAISKMFERLKDARTTYQRLTATYADLQDMLSLFADDEQALGQVHKDAIGLAKQAIAFKRALLLDGDYDGNDCFVAINAGAGGTESQDWAEMLLRMYIRFCEREGFTVQLIDQQQGEEAGIKGATIHVKHAHAYGLLKAEHGVHRLVRISPFDSAKRRHTSFASVTVTPEVGESAIEILDKDLRIDTYRAGGAGGQHVNKTDSAVRITHLPTNIVTQCQNERSQTQNKQTAMKMLMARLVQKREEEKQAAAQAVEKQKIEWGSQIRSYVLHPYKMVKDLRTDHESPQPDVVLDGDLMPFIEKWLLLQAAE